MDDRLGKELAANDPVWFRTDGGWCIGKVDSLRCTVFSLHVYCETRDGRSRLVASSDIEKIPPEPSEPTFVEVERMAFERDLFEKYPRQENIIARESSGEYESSMVENRWRGWLTRARQAQEDTSAAT